MSVLKTFFDINKYLQSKEKKDSLIIYHSYISLRVPWAKVLPGPTHSQETHVKDKNSILTARDEDMIF